MHTLKKEKIIARKMNYLETEEAIMFIKRAFQDYLAEELDLYRVSAPLFVETESGFQDNLNGIERPVKFEINRTGNIEYEIVHSLAKWKRYALAKYEIQPGSGIYTDMNAIRRDEETLDSGIHSVYVDQWDWEKTIKKEDRNLDTLKTTVMKIFTALRKTEFAVCAKYDFQPLLPENLKFIHTEELAELYPELTPREREDEIAREYGAVFVIGIGGVLDEGIIHDGRAPDYDDWSTETEPGRNGLNGDLIVWNPVLGSGFELSSMGIRVDKKSLIKQLEIRNCPERLELPWHKMLMEDKLPESIGGGIGQSRICMFILGKKHIGEVQVSVWPDSVRKDCEEKGIRLL